MQKGQIKQDNINKLWYFFMDGSLPPQTTGGNLLNEFVEYKLWFTKRYHKESKKP